MFYVCRDSKRNKRAPYSGVLTGNAPLMFYKYESAKKAIKLLKASAPNSWYIYDTIKKEIVSKSPNVLK